MRKFVFKPRFNFFDVIVVSTLAQIKIFDDVYLFVLFVIMCLLAGMLSAWQQNKIEDTK